VKQGAGALTLSGANTHSGGTTLNAGTLNINNATALGTGTFDINGGTIDNSTAGAITLTTNNVQTWDGDFTFTGTQDLNLGTGAVTLGANRQVTTSAKTLTVGGAIGGAFGLTKAGAGTLTLDGVNTYTGPTVVNAGTLNLNQSLTASLLSFSGAGTVNLADNMNVSSGAVTTTANNQGTFNFLGTHTTSGTIGAAGLALAAINVQNGTVTMDHDLAATTTTVDSVAGGGTGTLTVTGGRTITGDLTLANSGVLNLGSNTLTLAGTGIYTMSGGQTMNLNIANPGPFGNITASGVASVTEAPATVNTVNVTTGGFIPHGATYTVIDAAAGPALTVPGTITSTSLTTTFTGDVTSSLGDLILIANRSNSFDTLVTGDNNIAAAVALEAAGAENPTGDMLTVLNTLDNMTTAKAINDAISTMIPDVSAGVMQATRGLVNQAFGAIGSRLNGARIGGVASGVATGDMTNALGIWVQGLGSHMKQDERKGIQGFHANLFGTMIGADKLIDKHIRVGLAGAYGWADVKSKAAGSPSSSIDSWQGMIYGSFDSLDLCKAREKGKNSRIAVRNQGENFWYVDGMASFTQNNYDSRREIWLTSTDRRVAKAEHYAQQYSTQFETGYTFVTEKTKALEMTPFISLAYSYLYMNKYSEVGASALSLRVQGKGFHKLEQGLGTKIAYPIESEKAGTFVPSVKAAWVYDYIGDRFESRANFTGGGPSFQSKGAKPAQHGVLVGGEMAFLNKGNMTLTGNYDMELKEDYQSHTYYATARFDF
jgi:outer membrane autotransporter protein